MIHAKLFQSGDRFGQVVGVACATDLETVMLPVNAAVPFGLILNELVSNALKHAFHYQGTGEVEMNEPFGLSVLLLE